MKKHLYSDLSKKEISQLCRRPKMDFASIFGQVQPIVENVQAAGDKSVLDYTQKFDGVRPQPLAIHPQDQTVSISEPVKKAIDTAFTNIYRFHKAQLPMPLQVQTMPGVDCYRVARPIEKVGLYIPGGSAPLVSTLLMLGIPASIAECREIVIATPPEKNGEIADELIYIAQNIGATAILKTGGAQAIAAMGWGTQTIPKVDKIFGPGNQYVTAAKMILQNSEAQIAIDMPAGPSEVLVIADETANPAFVAADLLAQAEHGPDSQVVLVATKNFQWHKYEKALAIQLNDLPRKNIAKQALTKSFSIEVESTTDAIAFSNKYAPEHLILQCKQPEKWKDSIINAGSVFLGEWSTESVGDYASGTNHTLPTYGYARMYSGISVNSFVKFITMQQLSAEGLKNIGPTVETLAELETLEAHKRAVTIRLKELGIRN